MNLRVAKAIKWFFENIANMFFLVAGIVLVSSMGWEAVAVVSLALLVIGVVGLVVWGCSKLYEKADRTVREVEDGEEFNE